MGVFVCNTTLQCVCLICVTGEFNSGKSTFLNILLGGNYVPVARKRTTNVVCEIRHSKERKAELLFARGRKKIVELETDRNGEGWKFVRDCIQEKHTPAINPAERIPVKRVIISWPMSFVEVRYYD